VRGQLPIVIALVIVGSVMLASLYFITALNTRFYARPLSYIQVEWLLIDSELDKLTMIALREASQRAERVFDSSCPEDDQVIDDKKLNECTSKANVAFQKYVEWALGNWSQIKMREGYIAEFKRIQAEYYIGDGYGYSMVAYRVLITNPSGEIRVFDKNITVKLYATVDASDAEDTENLNFKKLKDALKKLRISDVYITYTFNLTVHVISNDIRMYYAANPEDIDLVVKKINKKLMKQLQRTQLNYMLVTHYTGSGENIGVAAIVIDEKLLKNLKGGGLKNLFKNLGKVVVTLEVDEVAVGASLRLKP